jgi:hypothetical protein
MVTENRDDAADIPIDTPELSVFLRKQASHTNGSSNGSGAGNDTGSRLSMPQRRTIEQAYRHRPLS